MNATCAREGSAECEGGGVSLGPCRVGADHARRDTVAIEALVSLLRSLEVPEGAGVRLAHGLTAGGEPSIGLTIVSRRDATDEVVDAGAGVDVFVDHAAADALDDQQLDVGTDGERVAFTLRRQPQCGGPASDHSQEQ